MSDSTNPNASFQLILDTAEKLIDEKGCRQTTLQDIIERSGLSKGAIYHYVSGKDELFGRILISKMETINDSFNESVSQASKGDAASPVQLIAKGMLANTDSQSVTNKIFTYLLSQSDNPKIAAILNNLYHYTLRLSTEWIKIGQTSGAIPPHIDAAKMSMLFTIFTYGLRTQRVITKDEDQVDFEDIFRLIFRSLQ
ncbi:hypothetical protein Back11_49070 [Paenibacillus baekrokdamisoli]|uniref:Uncharacterized protein n=1 Tax=Paenibacillus baekrokdamisoli TaxID=1712516 RepID=A0A3G9IZ57_9BACL|nr:TetR/AcrR family transcriptional regulator [Paenibacillus baekrokdamisoli]MBB3068731.1 AcrR family transcriptional regulator [Paenibacillus baekrokdamisoli]BBH23562.1 hypothetical protein Back11_49070 [Paenibacillus baekrokdamisoli]